MDKHSADRETSMDKDAASRIQSAADRHPESESATSGFSQRAQSAADRAANTDDEDDEK